MRWLLLFLPMLAAAENPASVGHVESGFNPQARSPKNAVGVRQLIPDTAAGDPPPALERIMAAVGQVESGFNPQARSPKNAVGVWQLIPDSAAEDTPPALERIMAAVGQVESGFNPQARSPKNAVGVWQLIPDSAAEDTPPALERIMAAVGQVESGFNPQARSPKNAVGVWQLIPDTARRFGLRVDATVDERTDTPKATIAAARYLRFLFNRFGDWPLTLAAYNAGEARVQSAITRAGSRQFNIVKAYLPAETAAYVPAVLAAQPTTTRTAPTTESAAYPRAILAAQSTRRAAAEAPEVAVEPPKSAPIVIAPFSLAP